MNADNDHAETVEMQTTNQKIGAREKTAGRSNDSYMSDQRKKVLTYQFKFCGMQNGKAEVNVMIQIYEKCTKSQERLGSEEQSEI